MVTQISAPLLKSTCNAPAAASNALKIELLLYNYRITAHKI